MSEKSDFIYTDPSDVQSASGSTPYGIYDADAVFASESIQVCKWTARRLGHPVTQLEFNSSSIYAMFEEAVSEYSQHINNFNMRNWMWDQFGGSTSSFGDTMSTGSAVAYEPKVPGQAWQLSKQYGTMAGVGGDVTLYSGSIVLTGSQQTYDLTDTDVTDYEHSSQDISDRQLVVQNVYNHGPAAISKFYDPLAGAYDQGILLDEMGMDNVAPAVSYLLNPLYSDILRAQAVESSDYIRKSAYSFHISNNRMKIFPVPTGSDEGQRIWFEYYVEKELTQITGSDAQAAVTDPSNAPYKFLPYHQINASGRQWVRKYTLALSKELLGIIRSKYASMPLPNGEVTLDGEALKAEGREEKTLLLEELNTFLETLSKTSAAEAEAATANANQEVLNKAPLGIYLG